MTIALREALADVDDAVAAKLAENDIVSIEDAAELTAADLDSLGFTLGGSSRECEPESLAWPRNYERFESLRATQFSARAGGSAQQNSPRCSGCEAHARFLDGGRLDGLGEEPAFQAALRTQWRRLEHSRGGARR
jgi:hypothetical protein